MAYKMSMRIFGSVCFNRKKDRNYYYAAIAAACAACLKPHVFEIVAARPSYKSDTDFENAIEELLDEVDKTPDDYALTATAVYAPSREVNTLKHLPEKVERAFLSAIENMKSAHGADAAAIMFRRAIENAIKIAYPDAKGSLIKKIDTLAEQRILPEIMKDWAHQIRLIGNDGAHEIEGVTQQDVTAAYNFTDAFLRYLITLPEEVRLRRGEEVQA